MKMKANNLYTSKKNLATSTKSPTFACPTQQIMTFPFTVAAKKGRELTFGGNEGEGVILLQGTGKNIMPRINKISKTDETRNLRLMSNELPAPSSNYNYVIFLLRNKYYYLTSLAFP